VRRGSRFRRGVVGLAAVTMSLVLGMPQAATAATRSLGIVARDYSFSGISSRLVAGDYDTRFVNGSRKEPHEVVALNLGPACAGLTRQQVVAHLDADTIELACPDIAFEGFAFAPPLGRDRVSFTLDAGRTLFVCFIPTPQGIPHYQLGMLALSDVITVG